VFYGYNGKRSPFYSVPIKGFGEYGGLSWSYCCHARICTPPCNVYVVIVFQCSALGLPGQLGWLSPSHPTGFDSPLRKRLDELSDCPANPAFVPVKYAPVELGQAQINLPHYHCVQGSFRSKNFFPWHQTSGKLSGNREARPVQNCGSSVSVTGAKRVRSRQMRRRGL